jgi:hypothetical protein
MMIAKLQPGMNIHEITDGMYRVSRPNSWIDELVRASHKRYLCYLEVSVCKQKQCGSAE